MPKKTIKLNTPIQIDGQPAITEIPYPREPKAKDIKRMRQVEDKIEQTCILIQDLCELTPEQVDEIGVKDFHKLNDELTKYLA